MIRLLAFSSLLFLVGCVSTGYNPSYILTESEKETPESHKSQVTEAVR